MFSISLKRNNITNNKTITGTMLTVLSSWPKQLTEFIRFIWWVQTERQVTANPHTKSTNLGSESANMLLTNASTISTYYSPANSRKLSRFRHCGKAWWMCCDKYNCSQKILGSLKNKIDKVWHPLGTERLMVVLSVCNFYFPENQSYIKSVMTNNCYVNKPTRSL